MMPWASSSQPCSATAPTDSVFFLITGVHRRRVRVKRNPALSVQESTTSPSRSAALSTTLPFPASAGSKAPLLSPGSYDAQELLRHRARSASGASDADLDWIRTGGSFARVTNVRAAAAAAAAANANSPSSVKHPDVGVEGALGLLDTDVEDSGTESGRTSPINTFGRDSSGRPKIRKGLGGSFFGFTPMDNKNEEDSRSIQAGGASGPPSPNSENPTSNQLDAHATNLSESLSSLTSTKSAAGVSVNSSSNDTNGSWVGINQEEIASRDIAAASDLEPPHRPSLYRAET